MQHAKTKKLMCAESDHGCVKFITCRQHWSLTSDSGADGLETRAVEPEPKQFGMVGTAVKEI